MKVYFKALTSILASPKAWWSEFFTRLPDNGVDQFWLKLYTPTQEPEAGSRLRRYIRNAILIWFAFVIVGGFWLSTADKNFLNLSDIFTGLKGIDTITGLRNAGLAIGTLAAGLLAVITLANSLNRTVQNDETIANERRKSDAEIFARSTDQLGNEKTPTRLGALYALEALAKDTLDREGPGSHLARQILETFAAFIREQSRPLVKAWNDEYPDAVIKEIHMPYRDDKGGFHVEQFNDYIGALEPAPEDIQTAFKIIVRSFPVEARPGFGEGVLNLRKTWLVKINMPHGSNLQKLNLTQAHMEKAVLAKAHMKRAYLVRAHMEETYLAEAHMEGANLSGADMVGADMLVAHMEEAYLTEAHMKNTNLSSTDFKGSYGLSKKQLAVACWDPDMPPINVPEHLLPLPHDGKGNPLKPDTSAEEEQ